MQVCIVPPRHQVMASIPSALYTRQLTAMAHHSEKTAALRSQDSPGNVPQLQMHETSDPMLQAPKQEKKNREAAHGQLLVQDTISQLPPSFLRPLCPPCPVPSPARPSFNT